MGQFSYILYSSVIFQSAFQNHVNWLWSCVVSVPFLRDLVIHIWRWFFTDTVSVQAGRGWEYRLDKKFGFFMPRFNFGWLFIKYKGFLESLLNYDTLSNNLFLRKTKNICHILLLDWRGMIISNKCCTLYVKPWLTCLTLREVTS